MKMNPHVAISETGFLFHASTGDSFTVNPIGQKIIQWIREGLDRRAILAALKEQYEADPERIEEDLEDFLRYLHQLKILSDG